MADQRETGPEEATSRPVDTCATNATGNIAESASATPPKMLDVALRYAKRGWPVLPLHSIKNDGRCSCGQPNDAPKHRPGKHPISELVHHGVHDATTDPEVIAGWWSRYPRANIGIAMRDMIVVDTDKKVSKASGNVVDGEQTLDRLTIGHGVLPWTLSADTGSGGKHRYFRLAGGAHGGANFKGHEHLDIIGNGGYVVAAPSNHVSGGRYEWINEYTEIAAAPTWLVELVDGEARDFDDEVQRREATAEEVKRITRRCEFVIHCRDHAAEIDGGLWTDLGTNLAMLGRAGAAAFHGLSARDPDRYDAREAQRRLDKARGPARCETISRHGWRCPRMDDDGKCTLPGGGRSPVVLAKEKKRRKNDDDPLADILTEAELWHTDTDGAYATIERDGHHEHMRIKSAAFREWLAWRLLRKAGRTAGEDALRKACVYAAAIARFDGEQHKAWLRVARDGERIYLDLCDDKWRAVEIDAEGWRVVERPPVRFRRTPNMQPLPEPRNGGSFAAMRKLLNIGERDWRMLVGALVGALLPEGPFVIVLIIGAAGTTKSWLLSFIRTLIDPNRGDRRGLPAKEDDLVVQAAHNWICSFDNVSTLSPEMADAMCRTATGGGLGKRTLYTDDDEFVLDAKRLQVITGIDVPTERQDFIDRTLTITLTPIEDDDRLAESEIEPMVAEVRASILGAICTAAGSAISRLKETYVAVRKRPRMADFALWVEAAGPALGWGMQPGRSTYFVEEFTESVRGTLKSINDADQFATAVVEWVNETGPCEGTAKQLQRGLHEHVTGKGDAGVKMMESRHWPHGTLRFQKALRRKSTGLGAAGLNYEEWRDVELNMQRYRLGVAGRDALRSAGVSECEPLC